MKNYTLSSRQSPFGRGHLGDSPGLQRCQIWYYRSIMGLREVVDCVPAKSYSKINPNPRTRSQETLQNPLNSITISSTCLMLRTTDKVITKKRGTFCLTSTIILQLRRNMHLPILINCYMVCRYTVRKKAYSKKM